MSRFRQVVLIRLVSAADGLPSCIEYVIHSARAEAVQERPGTGIGVRSKGRYQRAKGKIEKE